MKKNPMKITATVFITVIVVFMLSIFTRLVTKNIVVEKMKISNSVTSFIMKGMSIMDALDEVTGEFYTKVEWDKLYPFDSTADNNQINNIGKNSIVDNYKSKIYHVKNVLNDYCDLYLTGRVKLVEKAYAFEKLFDWTLIPLGSSNGIIIKDDGYLTYVSDEMNVDDMANHLEAFRDYLDQKDIPLLYVQAPSKLDPVNLILPAGVNDHTNENIDALLMKLTEKDVDYYDLREFIVDEYSNYEDAFYKTDHHWKTTTAFRGVQKLAEYMNEKKYMAFDTDKIDSSNYDVEIYEKYFLGSQGKKVTLSVVEPEDYQLMVPKFDTNFTIQIPERNVDISGQFKDTLLDYRHLEKIDYYNENCYGSFMNRNDVYCRIINNDENVQNKKVLIIKDSYSTPFIPYLAMDVKQIDTIYELLFDGSIRTYVEKEQPDMIIVMYSATSMSPDVSSHSSFYNLE